MHELCSLKYSYAIERIMYNVVIYWTSTLNKQLFRRLSKSNYEINVYKWLKMAVDMWNKHVSHFSIPSHHSSLWLCILCVYAILTENEIKNSRKFCCWFSSTQNGTWSQTPQTFNKNRAIRIKWDLKQIKIQQQWA